MFECQNANTDQTTQQKMTTRSPPRMRTRTQWGSMSESGQIERESAFGGLVGARPCFYVLTVHVR